MAPIDKSLKCHKDPFEVRSLPIWHHLHNILTTLSSPTASVNKQYKHSRHNYTPRGTQLHTVAVHCKAVTGEGVVINPTG